MRLRSTEALTAAITAADRTQAQIARAARCSRQFVQQLATGRRHACTLHVAVRIEDYLQVTPGSLFVDNGARELLTGSPRAKGRAR